jgi:S-adenosylmethionine:tRNA ribosyltransferase-isomerase
MRSVEFDYHLPPELIAQAPTARRDESRLLVVNRRTRTLQHRRFRDLPEFISAGDLLIRNTARVLPARLFARRPTGGQVECLLLRPSGAASDTWWCLLRPGRKLPAGATFGRDGEFTAEVQEKSASAEFLVRFASVRAGESVTELAERLGSIPLPPYITRDAAALAAQTAEVPAAGTAAHDRERYQTVFARPERTVAVAAPTAGLHFTPELLTAVEARGARFADVVLHVGLGTFRPIETEFVADHPIHREMIEIPPAARVAIDGPCAGRRIAVGTTSVRTTEFYARHPERGQAPQHAFTAEADLFLYPPAEFRVVDALITNFHLPRSTLLCLVSAFLTPGSTDGVAWLREIYAAAIAERYRFLSYGDAMLIL